MRKLKSVPRDESSESVEDVSRRLEEAIRESDREADEAEKKRRRDLARATVFDNANADEERTMPRTMHQIVDSHFPEGYDEQDLMREYRELHDGLRRSFERGEEQWQRAHTLYIRFRMMRFEWEHDNRKLFASMRARANEELQAEKKQGLRNKAITDADTDAMCALLFGDEWKVQESRRKKAEFTERSLSNLVDAWASKCGGWRRVDR